MKKFLYVYIFNHTPNKILLFFCYTISLIEFSISPFLRKIQYRHIPIDLICEIMTILG